MLNLGSKYIVLRHDVIWLNKTYGECVQRKENTSADTYILQDEEKYYNWDHIKVDPVKNEVNT